MRNLFREVHVEKNAKLSGSIIIHLLSGTKAHTKEPYYSYKSVFLTMPYLPGTESGIEYHLADSHRGTTDQKIYMKDLIWAILVETFFELLFERRRL